MGCSKYFIYRPTPIAYLASLSVSGIMYQS